MQPERKRNRLAEYSYSQPGAYFVTVCTQDRKQILSRVVGADDHIGPYIQLTPIGAVVERYLRQIPGIGEYVIMPNHVHMILRISASSPLEGPIWQDVPCDRSVVNLVRTWKTLITKELGQSIWQRSYYDHVIRNQQEYNEIADYIQYNPAKWQTDDYY